MDKKKETMPLKGKQSLFCAEYIIDMNATQACIRAGYSKKTAAEIGYENLRKPHIIDKIKELMSERAKRVEISSDYVLTNIKEVGERCMQHIEVKGSDGTSIGEYKFEHTGALKALELLGKNMGMFKDVVEVIGKTHEELLDELDDEINDE